MRDFKYIELVTDNPKWDTLLADLAQVISPSLKDCANSFKENIERTASFAILPVELFWQGTRNTRMTANAIFSATGIGSMTLEEQMDIEASPDMLLEFAKEAGQYDRMSPSTLNALRLNIGLHQVNRFLAHNENMRSSIDALFTSIVLESWLFFEALASDAWVAAVDHGGPQISGRILLNQRWEKSEMLASSIPSAHANPKTHPGSFRREIGQVSFQKLRSIKDYYKIAFGDTISKSFDEAFGGYVHALSAVRNVIAHNAGRVDGAFERAVERFGDWKHLKVGDKILLDGATAKKLRNAALETGVSILKHIDSVLQSGG